MKLIIRVDPKFQQRTEQALNIVQGSIRTFPGRKKQFEDVKIDFGTVEKVAPFLLTQKNTEVTVNPTDLVLVWEGDRKLLHTNGPSLLFGVAISGTSIINGVAIFNRYKREATPKKIYGEILLYETSQPYLRWYETEEIFINRMIDPDTGFNERYEMFYKVQHLIGDLDHADVIVTPEYMKTLPEGTSAALALGVLKFLWRNERILLSN